MWDPQSHLELELESLAEEDALDPGVDCFLQSDDGDNDDHMGADVSDDHMADALLNAGVDQEDAAIFVRAMRKTQSRKPNSGTGTDREGYRHIVRCERTTRSADPKPAPAVEAVTGPDATFVEVYGGGSLSKAAETSRRILLKRTGLAALVLRTLKPNGTPWDFSKKKDRIEAKYLVERKKPDWHIGSPPCTNSSLWNRAMNYRKMDAKDVQKKISKGRKHLNFVVSLYRDQLRRGRHFLHEHPQTASSWQEVWIKSLSKDTFLHLLTVDQCMYGMFTPDAKGAILLLLKSLPLS